MSDIQEQNASSRGTLDKMIDIDVWSRILAWRRRQWKGLKDKEILTEMYETASNDDFVPPQHMEDICDMLEWVLNKHMHRIVDENLPASIRRNSWNCVEGLLSRVDNMKSKNGRRNSSSKTGTTSSDIGTTSTTISKRKSHGSSSAKTNNGNTTSMNSEEGRRGSSSRAAAVPSGRGTTSTTTPTTNLARSSETTTNNPISIETSQIEKDARVTSLANDSNQADKAKTATVLVTPPENSPRTQTHPSSVSTKHTTAGASAQTEASAQVTSSAPAAVQKGRSMQEGTTAVNSAGASSVATNNHASNGKAPTTTPLKSRPGKEVITKANELFSSNMLLPGELIDKLQEDLGTKLSGSDKDIVTARFKALKNASSKRRSIPSNTSVVAATTATPVVTLPPPSRLPQINGILASDDRSGSSKSSLVNLEGSTRVNGNTGLSLGDGTAELMMKKLMEEKKLAGNRKEKDVAITFPAENNSPTFSGALQGRGIITTSHDPVVLTAEQGKELGTRLSHWDPYWKFVKVISCGQTCKIKTINGGPVTNKSPKMADEILFQIPSEFADMVQMWGKSRKEVYADDQIALILRMLPIKQDLKKRGDTHLWPKGTAILANGNQIRITQRRQQAHEHSEWKGMCHPLDLTQHIVAPTSDNTIRLCTYDDQPYFYCLALCAFRAPATLHTRLISPGSILEKLNREQSIAKALTFASQETVVLDDDDDDDDQLADVGRFVFTLTCPISKALMKTPVRGKTCTHWQCFDLFNFLQSNLHVSGSRWRCASCERFLNFKDLQLCGLTADMLQEFKDNASSARDRVEFCSDKSYRLLEQKKQRYGAKRRGSSDNSQPGFSKKRKNQVEEIILL